MKFALIFLMVFVAVSQQFYLQRPNIPMVWLAPHPAAARYFFNNYRPLLSFNEDLNNRDLIANSHGNTDDVDQAEYPDVQSRIKSRPAMLFDKQSQSGRFLAGSFGNTNGYTYNGNQINYPFFKTYTTTTTSTSTTISLSTSTSTSTTTSLTTSTSTAVITNTATLSLTSVVKCVPSLQLSAVPVSCRRKRREIDQDDNEERYQFAISPSETLKLMPTALPTETRELAVLPAEHLTSSKDEVAAEVMSLNHQEDHQRREKRFFLLNRNYYSTSTVTATSTSVIVIPTTTVTQSISTSTAFATTTSTTFVFSNSTVTQTVNLISPAPTAQCKAAAAAAGDVVCVACLPAGYVVCAASG